jgi:hypothetical protein
MAGTTGGCLCGAVRYTLAEAPTQYGACHCGMCRRWTGGVDMGVELSPGALSWDRDAQLRTWRSSDWAERGFCGTCGSGLFWRMVAAGPKHGVMSLCVGSLDDPAGLVFESEVFIDMKPDSYAFAGERTRLTGAEVMARDADMSKGDAQ